MKRESYKKKKRKKFLKQVCKKMKKIKGVNKKKRKIRAKKNLKSK